jgi:hypothetical protein
VEPKKTILSGWATATIRFTISFRYKEFHVVLEEPTNDALQSFQKMSGLLKDLDADSIKLFDETVQHNRFFRETKQ